MSIPGSTKPGRPTGPVQPPRQPTPTPAAATEIEALISGLVAALIIGLPTWLVYGHAPAGTSGDTLYASVREMEYDQSLGAPQSRLTRIAITITALATVNDPESTFARLAGLMTAGDGGVKSIVEADQTLGGAVQSIRVSRSRLAAPESFGDQALAAAEFDLEVLV